MGACGALRGYARLVALARANKGSGMDAGEAIRAAVSQCIEEGALADYLSCHRAEVEDMLFTIQDEERAMRVHQKAIEREARERGWNEGWAGGWDEGWAGGWDEGWAGGHSKGMETGRAEGIAEGIAEGRAEGIAEGLAEGLAEGRAAALKASIKSLMASTGCGLQEAMDLLNVPEEDRGALERDTLKRDAEQPLA